ncbi:class I SAM-dependent methyltransferase [Rhodoblastus sp.]|uniref:class I SAM-dependent methyltransferase n=1 Tax=Rhodoblastus sp. TaxID=1962975 RepID=UPI003F961F63
MTEVKKRRLLNAGSGASIGGKLPPFFSPGSWEEVRLDVDPATRPDIIASLADMRRAVPDASFDALYSSHAVEHLYAHEVIPAFHEFRRVIKPDGFALITCPDLVAISRFILQYGAEEVAYSSPAGPIRPIDMLFGHGRSIGEGRVAMAHHTGFTAARLARVAIESGFKEVRASEGHFFDLWTILLGPQASEAAIAPMFAGTDLSRLFVRPANPAAPAQPLGPADANA